MTRHRPVHFRTDGSGLDPDWIRERARSLRSETLRHLGRTLSARLTRWIRQRRPAARPRGIGTRERHC